MHPNPVYRKTPEETNIAFARELSFGVLAVNAQHGPLLSHIPFQLSADGTYLEAHLVRSNPIVRLLKSPVEGVISVSGGDGYISPDWYGIENQVPTWNYVAVHLRGVLELLSDDALRGVLDRLSAQMEALLAPKTPWTIKKMDSEIFAKMSRQIVPIVMKVNDIQGTWKLSQNKLDSARIGAAQGVEQAQLSSQTSEIARLMNLMESD
jgi:transcriptional regulator